MKYKDVKALAGKLFWATLIIVAPFAVYLWLFHEYPAWFTFIVTVLVFMGAVGAGLLFWSLMLMAYLHRAHGTYRAREHYIGHTNAVYLANDLKDFALKQPAGQTEDIMIVLKYDKEDNVTGWKLRVKD